MNRRLSMALAGQCAYTQAVFLFAFHPLSLRVLGDDASRLADRDARLFGLDFDSFVVKDLGHIGGWLPQVVFLLLCTVLAYAVFRAAPGVRPRMRTVLELTGAMLLAAGIAELLGRAMDTSSRPADLSYVEWFVRIQVKQEPVASVQFALYIACATVFMWTVAWLLAQWRPMQELLGTTNTADGGEKGEEPAPLLATAPERRNAVAAGLIPVVLLAIVGGPVLRHLNTREMEQSSSVTFEPVYRPPALVEEWSGVLYPALRMRPLRTENTGGWLATLAICLVLLVVLAALLRAVAARAAGKHPLRVVMACWFATLVAAMAAALVESILLQGPGAVPRRNVEVAFNAASADAVRFGTVWGWATGAAFLGTVLMTRRGRRTEPRVDEGRPSRAE